MSIGTVYLIGAILVAIAVISALYQGKVTVDPGDRERLVIRDISGRMKILGPGEHYLLPWWTEFQRVSINREPVQVPGKDSSAEEVRSSDGVVLLLEYRYDILAGRPYRNNGQLNVRRIDDTSEVREDMILSAVTKIEYSDHQSQIHQRVQNGIESVFNSYGDEQLMLPEKEPHPKVPPAGRKWSVFADAVQVEPDANNQRDSLFPDGQDTEAKTSSELHEMLSHLIELEVNHQLRFLGINIVAFRITNLLYRDPKMQDAIETRSRSRLLRDGTAQEGNQAAQDLTDAQRFALGTDQLGQVSIGRGLEQLGEGISKGLEEGIRRAFGGDNQNEGDTDG